MRKTITILTILLLVLFMIGCENSVNPIQPQTQNDNEGMSLAKPFGGENNNVVAKKGPKPPKPDTPNKWYVPGDFETIQEAIDDVDVADGDKIFVGPGTFAGAEVTKGVEIRGVDNAVINDGPILASWTCEGVPVILKIGFLFPGNLEGSGANINHFNFDNIEFPVMSRGSDNVIIEHCNLYNPIQGISNWGGNGWTISHNEIVDLRTQNGGGIGILVGDRYARVGGISGTVVSHNKIYGVLTNGCGEGGGYDGTGIVLYSDARGSWPGAESIFNNKIEFNKVSLLPSPIVDVNALELTEAAVTPTGDIINDNIIKFNDFRGTATSIALTPESLADSNIFSKNKVN